MKTASSLCFTGLMCAASLSAQAQSSVTLYGVVDAGLTFIDHSRGQRTAFEMTSGRRDATRWGLKGNEELGGGLQAVFNVESGFSIANGAADHAGIELSRQAYVGLSDSRWGTLTFGRQYDPMVDLALPNQGDYWFGGLFTTPGDIDDADGNTRLNNSVKWLSQDWQGFRAGAAYGFGGAAGSVASGQTYGGALSYRGGPLGVAIGGLHIDNGNPGVSARQVTSAESIFFTAINQAYASAKSIDTARVSASYQLGTVVFGGYYSFAEYVPDGWSNYRRSEHFNTVSTFAHWQITPTFESQFGYNWMRSNGDSSATYQTIVLGALYTLSKRTSLYVEGGYAHASGSNGAGPAQAVTGSAMVDAGARAQMLVTAGIRQLF